MPEPDRADCLLWSPSPPPVSPRPFVQILLQKIIPSQALCDTGISCINPNTLKELPHPAPPGPNSDQSPLCKGASGTPLHNLGSVALQINLEPQHQMHKLQIIQELQEELILGTDFLYWHNLLCNPHSWTLLHRDPTPQGPFAQGHKHCGHRRCPGLARPLHHPSGSPAEND